MHGAGAQRSNPKTGDPADYPYGHGPQGDVIRIYNYVRLVRDADTTTDVGENDRKHPAQFELGQNYPNPFNPATTISFSLPKPNHVRLKIFDVRGRDVASLIDEVMNAGTHSVRWHANNSASGVYFYALKSGSFQQTRKMTLLQ